MEHKCNLPLSVGCIYAGVDRNRLAGKGNRVYVPAASDKGVVVLQTWLRRYAGNTRPVPTTAPPQVSRRELLDRWAMSC